MGTVSWTLAATDHQLISVASNQQKWN